jgi:hypothetical protein
LKKNGDGLIKEKELARVLGLSQNGIAKIRKRGQIPCYWIGAHPRYKLNEVLAFCKK